eukprot:m51a1_g14334 putative serine protease 27-like (1717) ;mRNA; r:128631-137854
MKTRATAFLSICVAVALAFDVRVADPSARIVNGNAVTSVDKYPWMISILRTSSVSGVTINSCGGALIAPTWVLTAAHCVDRGYDSLTHGCPRGSLVAAGTLTPRNASTGHRRAVVRAITHPDFDLNLMHNDVALLKIDRPITGVRLGRIATTGYLDLPAGTKVWGIGWGTLSESGVPSATLMETKMPIVSRADCRRLGNLTELLESTLCTGFNEGGRDTCQGDSGGPLLHVAEDGTYVQVGITSYGPGCARPQLPGAYTRVSEFRQWIDSTMAAVDRGDNVCGCPKQQIGNGYCNILCYSEECQWDGGDCTNRTCGAGCTADMLVNDVCDVQCITNDCGLDNNKCRGVCSELCLSSMIDNGVCDPYCLNHNCSYDGGDCAAYNNSCALFCLSGDIHNGVCDPACNVKQCNFDGGDCDKYARCQAPLEDLGDGKCNRLYNTSECLHDGGDCLFCAPRCSLSMINNSRCDPACYNAQCNWDGGMCKGLVGGHFCSAGCNSSHVGNGVCEEACFTKACNWDNDDCAKQTCNDGLCLKKWSGDGYCQPECATSASCGFEGGDCFDLKTSPQCAPGCFPVVHRHNGVCDPACMNSACGFDAPDCQSLEGCAPLCLKSWIHDGSCDTVLLFPLYLSMRTSAALLTACCVAVALAIDTRVSNPSARIVNGNAVTSVDKFPWMTSLMRTSPISGVTINSCGGALIAPTWVLTAAHCVDRGYDSLTHGCAPSFTVATGTLTPLDASTGQRRAIVRAITHPDFDLDLMHNDVALLKIDRPVTGVRFGRIAPTGYLDLPAGTKVWGIGWGTMYESGVPSATLMETKMPIVSRADCRRLGNDTALAESTLCTGFNEGGRDTCQGDSGGPLLHVAEDGTYVQVGITSYGPGCARPQLPGAYTRVSEFRQWIDSTMAAVDRGDNVCNCPQQQIGNGYCNILCYTEACRWDGGDCSNHSCSAGCTAAMLANSVCDPQCATDDCGLDNNICRGVCAERCVLSMVNNTHCDPACLTPRCSFDGNDCLSEFCSPKCAPNMVGNNVCNPECYNHNCSFDDGDCDEFNDTCALFCHNHDLHNGVCDPACNVAACKYDGGDCSKYAHCHAPLAALGNGQCNKRYNTSECLHDGGDCLFCAPRCSLSMINNSQCDSACYNAQCNWDGGMCKGLVGGHFCSVGCNSSQVGNGECDEACWNSACKWDNGDCRRSTCNDGLCLKKWSGDGFCQPECATSASCGFEGGDCFDLKTSPQCAPGCFPVVHRHNGVCDPACMNSACGFDAPDCQSLEGCAPLCLKSWIHDGACDTALSCSLSRVDAAERPSHELLLLDADTAPAALDILLRHPLPLCPRRTHVVVCFAREAPGAPESGARGAAGVLLCVAATCAATELPWAPLTLVSAEPAVREVRAVAASLRGRCSGPGSRGAVAAYDAALFAASHGLAAAETPAHSPVCSASSAAAAASAGGTAEGEEGGEDEAGLRAAYRERWGRTQREFSEQYGVDQPALSKWLRGAASPSARKAVARWVREQLHNWTPEAPLSPPDDRAALSAPATPLSAAAAAVHGHPEGSASEKQRSRFYHPIVSIEDSVASAASAPEAPPFHASSAEGGQQQHSRFYHTVIGLEDSVASAASAPEATPAHPGVHASTAGGKGAEVQWDVRRAGSGTGHSEGGAPVDGEDLDDERLRRVYSDRWDGSDSLFCKEHGIDASNFRKWKHGLRNSPASAKAVSLWAHSLSS